MRRVLAAEGTSGVDAEKRQSLPEGTSLVDNRCVIEVTGIAGRSTSTSHRRSSDRAGGPTVRQLGIRMNEDETTCWSCQSRSTFFMRRTHPSLAEWLVGISVGGIDSKCHRQYFYGFSRPTIHGGVRPRWSELPHQCLVQQNLPAARSIS